MFLTFTSHIVVYSIIVLGPIALLSPSPNPKISPAVSPTATGTSSGEGGKLSLSTPVEPPTFGKSFDEDNDPHDFRPPGPSDSRSPCPALNTLANHGYLPRDGKNIHISTYLAALQHPATYNISPKLAKVLAKGGAVLTEESDFSLLSSLFDDHLSLSLHHLALHNGVEHDASIVHKNTPPHTKYAPTRTDLLLLDDFLGNRTTIELADIAQRRVELERVSPINQQHAEIARGEWALVLDVFGRAHGGKIPADVLRVWLGENRFPTGWRPDHKQRFVETVKRSTEIRHAMERLRKRLEEHSFTDVRLARMLTVDPREGDT